MDMLPASNGATIENRTFDEIASGDSASIVRTSKAADFARFAAVSGDINPSHPEAA
jgi:acyl dehydratase